MSSLQSGSQLLLDNFFCFQLYAASRSLTSLYRPLLEPLGLTYPQYLVMVVLWEKDPVTVSQLGDRLLLDSGTLTPLLKKLESRLLLVRRRALKDERRVNIELTPAGRALKEKAEAVPSALCCQLNLNEQEAARIYDTMHSLLLRFRSEMSATPESCGADI